MRRFTPTQMANAARRFLPAQDGSTAIEYALMASGIAGVLVAGIALVGGSVTAMFTAIASIFN